MKVTLLVVVIFLFSNQLFISSFAQNCTQSKVCVTKPDAKCSGTFSTDGTGNCDPGNPDALCCPQYSYCINGKCILDNYGEKCSEKKDCYPDQIGTGLFDCIHGKCISIFNQGDKCGSDSNCYPPMKCVDGKCKGASEGGACTPPKKNGKEYTGFSCAFGLYCEGNKCRKTKTEGKNCSSSLECEPGTLCSPLGKCIKQFTLEKGKDCVIGLCSEKNACIDNKCVEGEIYPKPTVCYTDKDCSDGTCSKCNEFTGTQMCIAKDKKPHVNCQSEEAYMLKCFLRNNCSNTFSYQLGACQHDLCLLEMQAVWYCAMCIDEDSLGTCYGRFDINGHCIIPLPYWLVASILGGFLAVLMLILLVMCKIGDACRAEPDDLSIYRGIN